LRNLGGPDSEIYIIINSIANTAELHQYLLDVAENLIMLPDIFHAINVSIKTKVRVISLLIFLLPVYFFSIGDVYGNGFQTPIFRYQEIFLGSFLVLISNDLYNIIIGFFQGTMVFSLIAWFLGTSFLVVNAIYVFVSTKPLGRITRWSGLLLIISGICYLVSVMLHYGVLFHNFSGTALPLGLLLMFLLGIWEFNVQCIPDDIKTMPAECEPK